MFIKLFFITIVITTFSFANFYKGSFDGWFAYKDPKENVEDKNATKEQESKNKFVMPKDLNQLTAKEFEKLITDAKELATMKPTKENVRNLIVLQNFMHQKADEMTDTWADVMLENPELDMSVNIAKTSFARNAFNTATKEEKKEIFEKYSKYFHLILFYNSDNVEVSKQQDKVFEFIRYNHPEIKQLKIDVNNQKASALFKKLKINHDITPDIWLMIDLDGKQKWKRVAVGLSTQDKILNKVYEYGKEIKDKK